MIARFTRSGNKDAGVNKDTRIYRKSKIKIHALKDLFKLRIFMEKTSVKRLIDVKIQRDSKYIEIKIFKIKRRHKNL